jgi:hypothetical protein
MELDNRTGFAARLFSGNIGDGLKGAWVVARATFHLADGVLTPAAADARWPVFVQPVATDLGVFPADEYPFRRGCELVIAGEARAASPVTELVLRARVGDFTDTIVVVGDRVWLPGAAGLVPSDPQPFIAMPLTWERCFGGASTRNGLPAHHPLNPRGRGFYASEECAEGGPLPNFEDPAARITRWTDQPLPVGWGPVENAVTWQLAELARARVRRGQYDVPSVADSVGLGLALNPTASTPRNVMPALSAGDPVEVTGLAPTPIRFAVPDLALRLRCVVGDRVREHGLRYSGLWLFASHGLVVLTLRAAFSYRLRRAEARTATLWSEAP